MGIDNLIIEGFDWGEGNLEKCQKHGASISEIESIFTDEELTVFCDEKHFHEEERLIAVGQTKEKRNVLIILRSGNATKNNLFVLSAPVICIKRR